MGVSCLIVQYWKTRTGAGLLLLFRLEEGSHWQGGRGEHGRVQLGWESKACGL